MINNLDPERVWEAIFAVVLAIACGLARLLHFKDEEKLEFRRIVAELFVSGVTGMMTLLLIWNIGFSRSTLGFICGIAGYGGVKWLNKLLKKAETTIGLDKDDEDKGDDKKEG